MWKQPEISLKSLLFSENNYKSFRFVSTITCLTTNLYFLICKGVKLSPRKNNLWFSLWFLSPCLRHPRKLWKALSTPALNLIRCGYFLFFTVKTFTSSLMTGGVGKRLRCATRYVLLEFLLLLSFLPVALIKPIKPADPHSRVLKMGRILPAGLVFVKGLPGGQGMGVLTGRDSEGLSPGFCAPLPAVPRAPPTASAGSQAPRPAARGWHRCRLLRPPLCPRDPRRPAGGRPWLYLHRKQPVEAAHVWMKRWRAGTLAGGSLLIGI